MAHVGYKFLAAFFYLFQLGGHDVERPRQLAHLVHPGDGGPGAELALAHFFRRVGDDGQRTDDAAGVQRCARNGHKCRQRKADQYLQQ